MTQERDDYFEAASMKAKRIEQSRWHVERPLEDGKLPCIPTILARPRKHDRPGLPKDDVV